MTTNDNAALNQWFAAAYDKCVRVAYSLLSRDYQTAQDAVQDANCRLLEHSRREGYDLTERGVNWAVAFTRISCKQQRNTKGKVRCFSLDVPIHRDMDRTGHETTPDAYNLGPDKEAVYNELQAWLNGQLPEGWDRNFEEVGPSPEDHDQKLERQLAKGLPPGMEYDQYEALYQEVCDRLNERGSREYDRRANQVALAELTSFVQRLRRWHLQEMASRGTVFGEPLWDHARRHWHTWRGKYDWHQERWFYSRERWLGILQEQGIEPPC